MLLLAFALAWALLLALRPVLAGGNPAGLDWSQSISGRPVAELLAERTGPSLTLLGLALLFALAWALVAALGAAAVRALQARSGPLGDLLAAPGRVLVFGLAAAPPILAGALLLFLFALQLRLLPASGASPAGILLPAAALSLWPGLVAAQTAAGLGALPAPSAARRWLAAVLGGLGALLLSTGGLLSALVPVETLFAWPGVGRLAAESVFRRDVTLLWGVLAVFTLLVLAGRLAAEFCLWLARLALRWEAPWPAAADAPVALYPRAQHAGVVLALLALLLPLGLVVAGFVVNPQAALDTNLANRNSGPSPEHPLGTDSLGRDLQARALRGAAQTLLAAGALATGAFVPAALVGALAGALAARGRVWSEALASLFLLPVEALLFFPAVPAAAAVIGLLGSGLASLLAAAGLVLLPRVVMLAAAAWPGGGTPRPAERVWAAVLALWLGGLYLGFWLVLALDFLGLGTPPPTPSLGALLAESLAQALAQPVGLLAPVLVAWAAAVAIYLALSAVLARRAVGPLQAHLNS